MLIPTQRQFVVSFIDTNLFTDGESMLVVLHLEIDRIRRYSKWIGRYCILTCTYEFFGQKKKEHIFGMIRTSCT